MIRGPRLPAETTKRLPLMHRGSECAHLRALDVVAEPRAETCEECGIRSVLRVCMTCGHVGCCDSAGRHARAHSEATGHPLIRAWRGGAFVYCYEHGYQ
jgi:uncharacterized UBP type Zn finger protein